MNGTSRTPLTASKSAGVLITRLIRLEDRAAMMDKFEAVARAHGASQIGGNHVLEAILEERYYVRLAEGLQGGKGSGHTDPLADVEEERRILLEGDEREWRDYAARVVEDGATEAAQTARAKLVKEFGEHRDFLVEVCRDLHGVHLAVRSTPAVLAALPSEYEGIAVTKSVLVERPLSAVH